MARSQDGRWIRLAYDFAIPALVDVVRAGFATATIERVAMASRTIDVTRMRQWAGELLQWPKALAAGLALVLCGCFSDQQKQLGQCKFEFANRFPAEAILTVKWADYLTYCMQSGGYNFDLGPNGCSPSNYLNYEDAWCYAPMGGVANLVFEAEKWSAGRSAHRP